MEVLITYDPRWLQSVRRDSYCLLIGTISPDRLHIVCGLSLLDSDILDNEIPQHVIEDLTGMLPGGLHLVGVCKGDRVLYPIPRSSLSACGPIIVELGARLSIFHGSKLVSASPSKLRILFHQLKLSVRMEVHPNESQDMLSNWFDANVFLRESNQSNREDTLLVNHEADVVLSDWKRRYCGPHPRRIFQDFTLVAASTDNTMGLDKLFRHSLQRQAKIDQENHLIEAMPFPGMKLILCGKGLDIFRARGWSVTSNGERSENHVKKIGVISWVAAGVLCFGCAVALFLAQYNQ